MTNSIPDISSARRIETMPRKADRPATYPKGRTCQSARKCPAGTRLSIYNPDDECALCSAGPPKTEDTEDLAAVMSEAPTRA